MMADYGRISVPEANNRVFISNNILNHVYAYYP